MFGISDVFRLINVMTTVKGEIYLNKLLRENNTCMHCTIMFSFIQLYLNHGYTHYSGWVMS